MIENDYRTTTGEGAPEDAGELFAISLRMGLGVMDPMDAYKRYAELGYNVGGFGSSEEDFDFENFDMPNLSGYLEEISEAFENYLRENLPKLGDHMDEERVSGIIRQVTERVLDGDF